MYLIGVDAGGSKCRARIVTHDGLRLGDGVSGPANLRLGANVVRRSVMDACTAALQQAGLDTPALSRSSIVVGMAGVERVGRDPSLEPFTASDFGCEQLALITDAEIANLGAHNGIDGGTVIVGTGTVAIMKAGDTHHRFGGWGFPVSDTGGGAYIGLMGLQQSVRAADGLVKGSDLTRQIIERVGAPGPDLVKWIDTATATDYATLAPIVVTCAELGDPAAITIMRVAGSNVGELLLGLDQKGATRLCLQGGLATALVNWLEPGIRALVSEPLGEPVDGAVMEARRIAANASRST